MQVTAYVDVLSHWCLASYPTLQALRAMLADDVRLEIVLAPAFGRGTVGMTHDAEAWFYRRGTLAYGTTLSPAWCEGPQSSTWHANAAVAAAVEAGADVLDLGTRVSRAGMAEGRLIGREDEARRCVAELAGIAEDALGAAMRSDRIGASLDAGNVRLAAIGCAERPSWELVNDAGDHAYLQGVWQAEAILPLVRGMLEDERAYRSAGPLPDALR